MKNTETQFVVSLEGLELSKEQKKRIEKGIQDLVLQEIANIDHDVNMKVSKRFTAHPTWEDLWKKGQLAGFWIKGYPDFPPGGPIPN